MSHEPVLTAVGLGKRLGRRDVFSAVDLEVRPGQVVGISGGNGSGKSTLMRVLSGTASATAGVLRTTTAPKAIVPERFVPPDHLTPLSYLVHMGRLRGQRRGQTEPRALALLDELGVANARSSMLDELSKGNAQKVAIAQAFLSPVSLCFLDEPNTGLDDDTTVVVNAMIERAVASGTAIILTEHELTRTIRPDVQYRLQDARLTEVTPERASSTGAALITLRPSDRTSWDRLRAVAATVSLHRDEDVHDDDVSFTVEAGRVDDFLRTALDDGWSVRAVGPVPPTGGRR
ncbi:ATP-binding cassette domain-containing protein [Curtobacterium sp. CFBP9011]|uniref:ATP-binding cassette domain-containing protein n=1 Tax=Curtobacterium sp. CFBP9011 TaxID=3096530 RepID=UPI002A6AE842|nr:ATP-binding cassette domain-containing protein [Curtobacterium sp. CFBP9011]MDY1003722.1 ATP-binding cassette domain-containing protein [Curtobacterium sp. CFBP9011]